MGTFISENITSENDIISNNLYTTLLSGNTISGNTFYGDGSNLTNITLNPIINGNTNEIILNSSNVFSGNTNLQYNGSEFLLTGTSRFDGNFFIGGSSSVELRLQWFGTTPAGAAPGIVWTNMPSLPTTWLHQTSGTLTGDATYIVDLTEYTEFRFTFQRQVAGAAASNLVIQYSLNNSTWVVTPLVTLAIGTGTGARDSGWTPIPVGARTFIYIRLVGAGGNGTADPRLSPPTIIFR